MLHECVPVDDVGAAAQCRERVDAGDAACDGRQCRVQHIPECMHRSRNRRCGRRMGQRGVQLRLHAARMPAHVQRVCFGAALPVKKK